MVTTLTKRMAEEMTKYLHRIDINANTYTAKLIRWKELKFSVNCGLGNDVLVGVTY